jgi:3-deoxy-D-manno-octulosonic-acid transferase
MRLIHQSFTEIYFFAVRLISLWSPKAKLFIEGRKESIEKLNNFKRESGNLYWFHCASLGEFEQARPVIEKLKDIELCKIVITFFSPSGFEIRKNYELGDLILYLPKDSRKNARLLLNILKPTKIFFIKYEFWPNYLLEADNQKIPTYLVSGVFRKSQLFFKWYGTFMRSVLNTFNQIYVQDEGSYKLLKTINVDSIHSGDTRYDRVMSNSKNVKSFPLVEKFVNNNKVLLLGSTWQEDEDVLFPVLNKLSGYKIIIAPHEITESHLRSIETNLAKKSIRYSSLENVDRFNHEVLIIDNIGMLMHLYQFANVAYIGGAFGKGLHNILEPASFGVPTIFGPKFNKFPEAFDFIENNIGFTINDSDSFEKSFREIESQPKIKQKVIKYMNAKLGATNKIMEDLFK